MTQRHYFTNDGSYGQVTDDGFAIIKTSDFTSDEWFEIDCAPDSMKLDYAMAYRDVKDAVSPVETGQWHNVSDNLDYLIFELGRGNLDDDEVLDVLVQIREGLGLFNE